MSSLEGNIRLSEFYSEILVQDKGTYVPKRYSNDRTMAAVAWRPSIVPIVSVGVGTLPALLSECRLKKTPVVMTG